MAIVIKKKFLIMGNVNAITYKEIFPLIKGNKLWLGSSIHSGDTEFKIPSKHRSIVKKYRIDDNGNTFTKVNGVRWFTNLKYNVHLKPLILFRHYSPDLYPKYDNYDAINVDKVADIPCDYDGIIGVPITFLDRCDPKQFKILGCSGRGEELTGCHYEGTSNKVSIRGKEIYKRLFIRKVWENSKNEEFR